MNDELTLCMNCVEPPLDNDELVRIRHLLMQPRLTAVRMLIFGKRFTGRSIREANGQHDWWTHLRVRLWFLLHPSKREPDL